MPTLHIFRGLPGSGKTTAARKLAEETGAILIEPDMLLVEDGEYQYTPDRYAYAFRLSMDLISTACKGGADIIFADVLSCRRDVRVVYNNVDVSGGGLHRLYVHDLKITPEESKLRNRHNVRPEDIDRMAAEWEDWE